MDADRAEPGRILTERSTALRKHAGQIAFPGGKVEPVDDGPVGAALRELRARAAQAGVLHVLEEAYLPEIIHPEPAVPVAAGEPGELVLTTLGRRGSPLIRYRTGDLVTAAESPCSCGRLDLALEGGILGRADDMVVVRGVNVYPSAVEEILRSAGGVAE